MTLADLIRDRARRAGHDLRHVPDDELGLRLAHMPLDVADDLDMTCRWLSYGERVRQTNRRGRYSKED